jgi:molybdenum cofactor sulfurtransferase
LQIDATYLDHAGTTLYAQSLIDACAQDLKANLYGNPHSGADSSQRSSDRVGAARSHLLRYLNASSEHFDVVFVANATAAVKLVAEAFRDRATGFEYAYHQDCHTSLVGVRQLARSSHCFASERDLRQWLSHSSLLPWRRASRLVAFPGQSNLTGFRPSLSLCRQICQARSRIHDVYCLLDAAALLSTSELDLSDPGSAPDFTALSTYKIFGYPDLGALIVKKSSSGILLEKKYFGGGTVDMVTTDSIWHAKKRGIHDALEEGTLPFHNIASLDHALETHARLYGGPTVVSGHARYVAGVARSRMRQLIHRNGSPLCHIYGDDTHHGPVIAFNLMDTDGNFFRNYTVEHFAIQSKIALRVGGMCNPGGIQRELSIAFRYMKHNFDAGVRCGDDRDIPNDFNGAIGMVRASFGAMSSLADVNTFLDFIKTTFLDRSILELPVPGTASTVNSVSGREAKQESPVEDSVANEEKLDKSGTSKAKRSKVLSALRCF